MNVSVKIVSIITGFAATLLCALSAHAAQGAGATRLLVLGDSLAAGYGLPAPQSFTQQLQDALAARGHAVQVINAGVSGDTSAGGRARLDWVLAEKPDAAIVELGANDGLRGLDPIAMRDNLDAILVRLAKDNTPALFAGMKALPNYGADYVRAYESVFADLAMLHDVVFYPFFLEGVAANPALNQADGIHPNADGVAVIVRNILPSVEKLLARMAAAKAG